MTENSLIDIHEFTDIGYKPLVDYNGWRVAVLNYIDELEVENIPYFDKHNETDEVFVLLKGRCILYEAGEGSNISMVTGVDLTQGKIYNVRKGAWHTHTLSKDAMVLIVENRDTSMENSTRHEITEEARKAFKEIRNGLWKDEIK